MANIFREDDDSMAHSTFYYPLNDGSQFIVKRLSASLPILSGLIVDKINVDSKLISVNGSFWCRSLIYTGDLRSLPHMMTGVEFNDALRDAIESLESNGTSSALCKSNKLAYSWLYIPSDKYRFHRIIHTGGFSHTNNGGLDPSKETSCVVEFSGVLSHDEMAEEVAFANIGLEPIAFNCAINSYVIHAQDTLCVVEQARQVLKPHGIHLLGRFAEWQYYNMDNAIEAAMSLVERLTNGADSL
jgi:hypothetical protein